MTTTTKTMKLEVTFNIIANSPCHGVYSGTAELLGRTIADTMYESLKSEKEVITYLTKEIKGL